MVSGQSRATPLSLAIPGMGLPPGFRRVTSVCSGSRTDHVRNRSGTARDGPCKPVVMPTVEKLVMPAGYGETTGTQPWSDVSARLAAAKQYWVAIGRPSGSPHVVPVDGIWTDDVLYYGGSPETLHVRAARANP